MNIGIGILGGGSWGTALAILLANKNYETEMWLRDDNQLKAMEDTRVNRKYLPEVNLPQNLKLTNDLEKTILNKDIILIATPTHGVREILNKSKTYIRPEQIIVNIAKGVENESLLRISQIVKEILPNNKYAVLSGPSHAEEVAKDMPTTVVVASEDISVAKYIQDVFMTPNFRVYTNSDVIGVELAGALKNIIALGAGISDGLNYGDNTKAALMTRGMFEMARLGQEMGGQADTFSGLAGIGDLIVTCTSMLSRNRRAGILIGQGMKTEDVIKEIGMVVEGIKTTKSVFELAKKHKVEMPITEEIYGVIYNGEDVKDSVNNLMIRDKKHEMENQL